MVSCSRAITVIMAILPLKRKKITEVDSKGKMCFVIRPYASISRIITEFLNPDRGTIMTAKEYLGDIIGGSLMLRESRVIAELLITSPNEAQWHDAIVNDNVLQKTSVHSVKRMASTLRKRLQPMGETFWTELLKAPDDAAKQILLMATMCQSPVLTDFMATTLSDARQMFRESLRSEDWQEFILSRQRAVVGLDQYSESSIQKMGNNVFKILADSGYLESGRSKRLKNVYLQPQIREWASSLDCQKVYDVMETVR